MKYAYFVRVEDNKVKQCYTTLGRANEGAKYRGGEVYGVAIIEGKPRIVAKFYGICQYDDLNEEEKEIKL